MKIMGGNSMLDNLRLIQGKHLQHQIILFEKVIDKIPSVIDESDIDIAIL